MCPKIYAGNIVVLVAVLRNLVHLPVYHLVLCSLVRFSSHLLRNIMSRTKQRSLRKPKGRSKLQQNNFIAIHTRHLSSQKENKHPDTPNKPPKVQRKAKDAPKVIFGSVGNSASSAASHTVTASTIPESPQPLRDPGPLENAVKRANYYQRLFHNANRRLGRAKVTQNKHMLELDGVRKVATQTQKKLVRVKNDTVRITIHCKKKMEKLKETIRNARKKVQQLQSRCRRFPRQLALATQKAVLKSRR